MAVITVFNAKGESARRWSRFQAALATPLLAHPLDARRKMSSEVADLMGMAFRSDEICTTRVAENVSLAERPSRQVDVFRYAPQSKARAIINNW